MIMVKTQKADFNKQATFVAGALHKLIAIEQYENIDQRFADQRVHSLGSQKFYKLTKKQYAVALLMI